MNDVVIYSSPARNASQESRLEPDHRDPSIAFRPASVILKRPALAEKIILPGDRDRLGCVRQIRVRATSQRDEFSLCTSKFESDMVSLAVGLRVRRPSAYFLSFGRSGSTPRARSPTTTAAPYTGPKATSTAPSPIPMRPSGSIQRRHSPITIVALHRSRRARPWGRAGSPRCSR
jgi:hypothetical protein